jgi:DNA polymerase-3 subunit gamma/tau
VGEVPDSFSVTAEHTDRLVSQAERLSQGEIVRAIEMLAAGIGAIKEGSDPRIQLELALLKATQPQADVSLQALMFRIEQLEQRLGGARPEPASASPNASPADAPEAPRAAAQASPRAAAGPAAAVAEAVPEPAHTAAAVLELDRIQTLWPAVADAVCEQNAMVGALVGQARPLAIEGHRLTVAFPEDAAFSKKKAEANRELVTDALRGLTGQELGVVYELAPTPEDVPAPLSEEALIERLVAEFGAEEVFDDEDPPD